MPHLWQIFIDALECLNILENLLKSDFRLIWVIYGKSLNLLIVSAN